MFDSLVYFLICKCCLSVHYSTFILLIMPLDEPLFIQCREIFYPKGRESPMCCPVTIAKAQFGEKEEVHR